MKRPFVQEGVPIKHRRVGAPAGFDFLALPFDTQNLIFRHLEPRDIISLSCMDSMHRKYLSPFIFQNIKATWQKLLFENDKPIQERFFTKHSHYIEQIRIIDCYSFGEFHVDIFTKIFNQHLLPRLEHLLVNSSNSSNWLKYRQNDSIRKITLYFEKDHFETQNEFLSSNPKNIRQIVKSTSNNTSPRIFHLNHVHLFTSLTKLVLNNYHFNWGLDEEISTQHLQELRLHNCTWEYPFQLSQFNINHQLKVLSLNYSRNNPFVLSERFNVFLLTDDTGGLASLDQLEINIATENLITQTSVPSTAVSSFGRVWSSRLFCKFINRMSFPSLRILICHGWSINLHNFRSLLATLNREDNNLVKLDLLLVDPSDNYDLKLIEQIKKESQILFPWMKLNLKLTDDKIIESV
ncbi:predicted protein [Scheffersomyces stipitis CBS 6054]|uniref:F-box domain-containing protein n=1 Tax=Scheffersomyces stipitis (strain ATCC 58785 / CBS 6054 / NBRC 10063 / NRRL Y-11545) TaxID=322104 RepID=A3LVT9_PICST|nr:predicted protein [Scheffersomyces stipitis CBS 6054]ABN66839.2 predicted protein [Scheffersomyces stipitis CBS 6054]KAG2734229.1 hypothetical protein G9P44_002235 [Scheffersomyces stipitis]